MIKISTLITEVLDHPENAEDIFKSFLNTDLVNYVYNACILNLANKELFSIELKDVQIVKNKNDKLFFIYSIVCTAIGINKKSGKPLQYTITYSTYYDITEITEQLQTEKIFYRVTLTIEDSHLGDSIPTYSYTEYFSSKEVFQLIYVINAFIVANELKSIDSSHMPQ